MDTFADFAQSQQQQQNWIQPPPFPSPSTEHAYTHYYQPQQDKLSLNIASLTVTSPNSLSPSGPPPGVLSPVTPITPSSFHSHSHPFAFDPHTHSPAVPTRHYDDHHHHHHHHHHQHGVLGQTSSYESAPKRGSVSHSNRSPSSSSHSNSQLPRKRSFTAHPAGASAPPTSSSINLNGSSGGGVSQPNNNPSTSSSSSSSTSASVSLPSNSGVPTSRPGGVGVPLSVMNANNIHTPLVEVDPEEDGVYDDQDDPMDLEACPSSSLSCPNPAGGGGSPVEGSVCGEDFAFGSPAGASAPSSAGGGGTTGMGGSMGIIGKPVSTNNFVTKLYQMISDPKSAQFITWTEHGTSFVVSNVGEFSRSILGSHFKHNNFSSFVRQLNMYGFHKINRTPRAQRTSTDAQTWEFSHNKFLRGRPDLLDEIKRKALEPDPGVKHRIELPGELASQLNMMKDDVRRCTNELVVEKRKVDRLTKALGQLWDVVGKAFPGSVPPFSLDLLVDSAESPNIYITSPNSSSASRFPPPLSMNIHSIHGLNSPTSSPTTTDFPHSHVHPHAHAHNHSHNHSHSHSAHHGAHPLSRQHSFHHPHSASATTTAMSSRADKASTSSTPLPSSPSPGSISTTMEMDLYDNGACDPPHVSGRGGVKRQRLDENGSCNGSQQGASGGLGLSIGVGINGSGGSGPIEPSNMALISSVSSPGGLVGDNSSSHGLAVPKKNSNMRARSDSAPMGYLCSSGGGLHSQHPSSWLGMGSGGGLNGHGVVGRPRSGSGMMPPRIAIPSINMSNMNRGGQRG